MSEAAKLTYTVNEAASAIGVSRSKIYELVREKQLETFKWCGRTLIRADVLRECVRRRAEPPQPPVREAPPPQPVCGVYMLLHRGKVVYVGRSRELRHRLLAHRKSGRVFDEARIIACDIETSYWLEKELIRTLQPTQNLMRFARQAKVSERALEGLTAA